MFTNLALYSTKGVKPSKPRIEGDERDDDQGCCILSTQIAHCTTPGGTIKINFDMNGTRVVQLGSPQNRGKTQVYTTPKSWKFSKTEGTS